MFKKGETSNPFGSLPVGEDLKQARTLTKLEFERLVNKYLFMDWQTIEDTFNKNRKTIPVIEMMILSIIHKGVVEGDEKRMMFLLDRTIGQAVRVHRVITEVDDTRKSAPVTLTDEERLEMAEAFKKKILERRANTIDVTPLDKE